MAPSAHGQTGGETVPKPVDGSSAIDLNGEWSSPQWGHLDIKQNGDQLTLTPQTSRVFTGRLEGEVLNLTHLLTYEETARDLPDPVRKELARRQVTVLLSGRVRPDKNTIRLYYIDRFLQYDKKTLVIGEIKEVPLVESAIYRKLKCQPSANAEANELAAAKATLEKSRDIAQSIVAVKSGAGYWFAELYFYITRHEIEAEKTLHDPGFLLHFVPIFYDMYSQHAELFIKGKPDNLSPSWRAHFKDSSVSSDPGPNTQSVNDATVAVVSGVKAHIQGDMANALEEAYRSYSAKYCDVPAFDTFKVDFFQTNRPIFDKVKLEFLHEFVGLGVLGGSRMISPKLSSKAGELMGKGLDVNEIYGWRSVAWQEAKDRIEATEK